MSRWRWQRGDVPVGCLVGLVVLFIAALIAIKVVPVMSKMGEFERVVRNNADRANRIDYTDKRIVKNILDSAHELDLPVTEKDITVKRGDGRMRVRVEYTKEIPFPGYTYRWHKSLYEDRPLF